MKRVALIAVLASFTSLASAQTRIEPPSPVPVFGPGVQSGPPILFPFVAPRAPIPRGDLVGPASVLWTLAWTDRLIGDGFRRGPFGGFGRVGRFSRRGFGGFGGFVGTSRISSIGWTPYGSYGYQDMYGGYPYYTMDPYSSPNTASAPSNPYGSYAPWTPTPGNPYGPYANGQPAEAKPPAPPRYAPPR